MIARSARPHDPAFFDQDDALGPMASLQVESEQRFPQMAGSIERVAGIALELSNIFAVIRGNGALAAEMLPSDHDTQLLLATIRSAAQRASQILEQVVNVSQPQDFPAPHNEPLDLASIGDRVIADGRSAEYAGSDGSHVGPSRYRD